MEKTLDAIEVRVLGSLIEKQITTPEYYPLTLNSLVNACNQLTNRDPVVQYDDRIVARTLEALREKQLTWLVTQAGSRVPKYEQRLTESLKLTEQETAVLCVLMLRGPQTIGELRSRSARMYEFKDLEEVELTLQAMSSAEPAPLVTRLPRLPGTKESRFAHLLSGEVSVEDFSEGVERPEPATLQVRAENERLARLEESLNGLRNELDELKQAFADFKRQFE
ncbi:MAG TPA: YceH family protein [Blastocatellia bacterium]|nr:YceH family protein [Blastocatellia bacterium]